MELVMHMGAGAFFLRGWVQDSTFKVQGVADWEHEG